MPLNVTVASVPLSPLASILPLTRMLVRVKLYVPVVLVAMIGEEVPIDFGVTAVIITPVDRTRIHCGSAVVILAVRV